MITEAFRSLHVHVADYDT